MSTSRYSLVLPEKKNIWNWFSAIFHHKTETISNNNPTEITPDGRNYSLSRNQFYAYYLDWTFSIWGVIYFWQAAWLIYALSRLPRKSNENYLYIHPNTLHCSIFIFYIINMSLSIGWLFLWDQESFGVSIEKEVHRFHNRLLCFSQHVSFFSLHF